MIAVGNDMTWNNDSTFMSNDQSLAIQVLWQWRRRWRKWPLLHGAWNMNTHGVVMNPKRRASRWYQVCWGTGIHMRHTCRWMCGPFGTTIRLRSVILKQARALWVFVFISDSWDTQSSHLADFVWQAIQPKITTRCSASVKTLLAGTSSVLSCRPWWPTKPLQKLTWSSVWCVSWLPWVLCGFQCSCQHATWPCRHAFIPSWATAPAAQGSKGRHRSATLGILLSFALDCGVWLPSIYGWLGASGKRKKWRINHRTAWHQAKVLHFSSWPLFAHSRSVSGWSQRRRSMKLPTEL